MAAATGKPSQPPAPPNPHPNPLQNLPLKSAPIEASNKPSKPPSLSPPPPFLLAFPMGHGQSKSDPGMDLQAGMRPIRRKIEEAKQQKRMRKSSIVSTTELLNPEEREGMVDDESTLGAAEEAKKDEGTGSPETAATAVTAAEDKKEEKTTDKEEKAATVDAEKRVPGFKEEEEEEDVGRKLGSLASDGEQPGSPSFRFYCIDPARDSEDDSIKFGVDDKKGKLPQTHEEKKAHERKSSTISLNSNEDPEVKPLKEGKRRRLKVLTKGPSHVYNLLNVRNCYNHPSPSAGDSLLSPKNSTQNQDN